MNITSGREMPCAFSYTLIKRYVAQDLRSSTQLGEDFRNFQLEFKSIVILDE